MFSTSCWYRFYQNHAKLLLTSSFTFSHQEINHLHVAAVLMTAIMIIAFLTSIAIARRILRATSVLKVCFVLHEQATHLRHSFSLIVLVLQLTYVIN